MRTCLFVLSLLAGCYDPELHDCVSACNATAECISPQVCGTDGLCASPAIANRCNAILADAGNDAGVDARMDANVPEDAPSGACVAATCGMAGGTCAAGRCVIDRDGEMPVNCPVGMPCTVICDSDAACKKGVKCGGATDCVVQCLSDSACQDAGVDCGMAQTCDVTCVGSSACQKGSGMNRSVECRNSACEVTCNGSGACQEGVDVDPMGTCSAHCCGGGCEEGTDTCTRDSSC